MDSHEVTSLLHRWSQGDREALDHLMPIVYQQLRRIAERQMSGQDGHTLRTTALVHEAYLRLVGSEATFESRNHFFAVAARAMRSVLTDHARAHSRQKRGGELHRVPFEEAMAWTPESEGRILAIDESLRRLEEVDERKARTIEMLFFGGLTYQETAAVLGISEATVHRELKLAKAWLHRDLRTA